LGNFVIGPPLIESHSHSTSKLLLTAQQAINSVDISLGLPLHINCLSSPQSIPGLFNIPHTHLASSRGEGEPYDSQHSTSRAKDLLNRKLLFDTIFASLPKDCLTSKDGVSLIASTTQGNFGLAAPYGSDSYSRYMAHFFFHFLPTFFSGSYLV
jgi:hypothetical protein